MDRGNEPGPWGSWNREENPSDDNYDNHRREHDYSSNQDNEYTKSAVAPTGESAMPGNLTDTTETNTNDYGLGGGKDPRKGEGLEHGPASDQPGGKGVWGPSAQLPDDPGAKGAPQSQGDNSQALEVSLEGRQLWAFLDDAAAVLPNDQEEPVARSDYYPGEKGNIVSESGMPGSKPDAKPTPLVARPQHEESLQAETSLPGDLMVVPESNDQPVQPGRGYSEVDVTTPLSRMDDTVHDLRRDDWDQYQYSRPKTARNTNNG